MDELVQQMAEKVGISKDTAEKIMVVLHGQAANVPAMLTGDNETLAPLLSKLGIDRATVDRILAFLREHSAEVQQWLAGQGGGILQKAKEVLGGILGAKESK